MPRSHVTLEKHVCTVCGNVYDTGAILLDKHLRNRFRDDQPTVTGKGLCPTHQQEADQGYVFLVEIDPTKSAAPGADGMYHGDANVYRTGTVISIRRHVAEQMFTGEVAPMSFCDSALVTMLKGWLEQQGIDTTGGAPDAPVTH